MFPFRDVENLKIVLTNSSVFRYILESHVFLAGPFFQFSPLTVPDTDPGDSMWTCPLDDLLRRSQLFNSLKGLVLSTDRGCAPCRFAYLSLFHGQSTFPISVRHSKGVISIIPSKGWWRIWPLPFLLTPRSERAPFYLRMISHSYEVEPLSRVNKCYYSMTQWGLKGIGALKMCK